MWGAVMKLDPDYTINLTVDLTSECTLQIHLPCPCGTLHHWRGTFARSVLVRVSCGRVYRLDHIVKIAGYLVTDLTREEEMVVQHAQADGGHA
jgi:hypothetical protein